MIIVKENINRENLKNTYTKKQLNKIKAYYKLGKNNSNKFNNLTEELVKQLDKGSKLYCITKYGLIEETLVETKTIENKLMLVGTVYSFFAKDFGFLIFLNEEDLNNRIKDLKAKRNLSLIRKDDFDWRKLLKYEQKIQKYFNKYSSVFAELEEKIPVYGHFWNTQDNEYLYPENNHDLSLPSKALERQENCMDGKHMFVKIKDDVFWCQNCGTLVTGNYKGEIQIRNRYNKKVLDDVSYHYPLVPHFLPKKVK